MHAPRRVDVGVEHVARVALLVFGGVLAVAGLRRGDMSGLAVIALGIATITLAAILPRIERIRLFGKYGLDARLRPSSGEAAR